MAQQWYVRFPDEEAGPYSASELHRLAAEGTVSPDVLVSIDRQRWIKASQVRGLLIPKSPPSPTPDAATVAEDDASPGERTPAQGGVSASKVEAPLQAADRNNESVRAKAKLTVSSMNDAAKDLGARARDHARSDEAKELADRALGKASQATSSVEEHATDLTRLARDAGVATMPFWQKLLREIREIVGATSRQTARLIGYGYGTARTRVLLRKARGAQLALGNRMDEDGVGDAAIRGQIASLDDRIASVGLGKGSIKHMEVEKKGLMIRLAADALAQDVAPTGAAAEYSGAVSARNAVETHRSRWVQTRAGLVPQDTTSWRRIGLGYGVLMLALTLATAMFIRSANMSRVPAPSAAELGLEKMSRAISATVLSNSKHAVERSVTFSLDLWKEKWRGSVVDAENRWERDDRLKDVVSNPNLPDVKAAYKTNGDQIRKRRDEITNAGSNRLKEVRRAVKEKLEPITDKAGLAKAESEDLAALREAFQNQLDADLVAFKAELEAARARVIAVSDRATANALAHQLNNDVLKRIKRIKEEAEACPVPVVLGPDVELRPESRSTRLFLVKLYRAGTVKDLPQPDLIRVIDASLTTADTLLVKSALDLLGGIDDLVVFTQLAAKGSLDSPEFRKVVLGRLPALVKASGGTTSKDLLRKLIASLADSYLAVPRPGESADLDLAVKGVQQDETRQTQEFVWFLAAAALSGSGEADQQLFKLFVSAPPASHELLYLHQAAERRRFNYLVGALIAKRAGKDPVPAFHRCIDTIDAAKGRFNLIRIRDLNDFLFGWFATVDPAFAPEALRIYKLVFDDPEGQKLSGHEQILGRFEAFRLPAIFLTLGTFNGLPVEFLYQVDKLYWQSERVVAITTLRELGRLDRVSIEALKGLVDDPWKGTAAYPQNMLVRATQQVVIDEWILYAAALEERSGEVAQHAYLRAFLGQTGIRRSLRGDTDMFPYRVHALRRLLALRPASFPELVAYAAKEECPGTLRRAILCAYAVDHDRIGKEFIDKIPTKMPGTRFDPSTNRYVEGMLMAFEAVRTGTEPTAVRSADRKTVPGFAAVLLSYDRPELTRLALATLKYKSVRPEPPPAKVAVDSEGSEITPFHFMSRDSLLAALKRLNPDVNLQKVAGEYAKWESVVWPTVEDHARPKNLEQARRDFVTENSQLGFRTGRDTKPNALRAFEKDSSVILGEFREQASGKDAIHRVGRLVSSATEGLGRPPNACVDLQLRAEMLESIFADLQAFEVGVTDLTMRRALQRVVVQPLMKFLEEGPQVTARCRESAR